MKKERLIQLAFALFSGLFLTDCQNCDTPPGPLHIVYILADDMSPGDIQALNPRGKILTPNLDRLANEGVAFTRAYSGSAICSPTRYGVMTGRYCWREKIGLASGYSQPYIKNDQPTVPAFLRDMGYRTRMVGKWHLGGQWLARDGSEISERKPASAKVDFLKGISGGPVDRGFESWFGVIASLDMPPYVYFRNRLPLADPVKEYPGRSPFGNRPGAADPELRSVDVLGDLTREAVRIIRDHNTSEPLFLYFALTAPHSPVVPSAEWQNKSGLDEHADFRMQVDACVGQVRDALEQRGMGDNTLLVFTADNGSAKQAVQSMRGSGNHDSVDGRRGWKSTWFEGGHWVPFLVRWPLVS